MNNESLHTGSLFRKSPVVAEDKAEDSLPAFSLQFTEQDYYADVDEVGDHQYMQNRELSWLSFNERVLDQGADESVPLLERLNFISIFWSNLQEFFMVRVGSLTDLSYIKPPVRESKTYMSPKEQIRAIHERCAELYPIQESYYEHVRGSLAKEGVRHLRPEDLSEEQRNYLAGLVKYNITPFLSPQIINSRHPFPHLENGKLYILLRLDDEVDSKAKKKKKDKEKPEKKNKAAEGVMLGLIPLPHQVDRLIKLPGRGYQFILLEHAIEMFAEEIFSMYTIKHTNVICVTRNADMDASQGDDSSDEDYREHMKRLLKQRARLAPVRLECERPLSPVMEKLLLKKLGLKRYQVYDTTVPLDLSFTWGLGSKLPEKKRAKLSNPPFAPAWPSCFDRNRRIIDQVQEKEILLSYPYESMDPFVQLLKEASQDPSVISIKITLYRLASQSHLAEALIAAAENGKQVTALFELRARFDEFNNIEWSQRFEEAGCNVIYGFRDYKVHSKICCITRQTENGVQHITQLGTGNYNEKTAKLYTDLSFITTNEAFGRDAVEFFKNMQLENTSDNYDVLRVAPLQIKPCLIENIEREIEKARAGKPCGIFMKANSVTDKDVIEKLSEASQAGVGITLFIRGICCIIPGVRGATENVRVVSIVGRLLEHSRIYSFGVGDDCRMYLSSADLMTRNLDKRVEIAWPILNSDIKKRISDYLEICMHDTAKLRQLRPNLTYTPLGAFCEVDEDGNALPPFDAQNALIEKAARRAKDAVIERAITASNAEAPDDGAHSADEPAVSAEVSESCEQVSAAYGDDVAAPVPSGDAATVDHELTGALRAVSVESGGDDALACSELENAPSCPTELDGGAEAANTVESEEGFELEPFDAGDSFAIPASLDETAAASTAEDVAPESYGGQAHVEDAAASLDALEVAEEPSEAFSVEPERPLKLTWTKGNDAMAPAEPIEPEKPLTDFTVEELMSEGELEIGEATKLTDYTVGELTGFEPLGQDFAPDAANEIPGASTAAEPVLSEAAMPPTPETSKSTGGESGLSHLELEGVEIDSLPGAPAENVETAKEPVSTGELPHEDLSDGEKSDFFGEPAREMNIPSDKGFFSRLFKH